MIKKLIYLAAALGATTLFTGGCERILDNNVMYEGPREITADAQTLVYVPQEDATPKVTQVCYWLIRPGTEDLVGNESMTAMDSDGIFEFNFFTVTVVGQNIVLDIDENTSDCYREITIDFQCEGYDPDSIIVTQFPAGYEITD